MDEHLCNAVRRAVERTNNFAGYAQVPLRTDSQNGYSYSCSSGGSYATYNANTLDPWQELIVEQKGWAGAASYACAQGCAGTCTSTGHKGDLAPQTVVAGGSVTEQAGSTYTVSGTNPLTGRHDTKMVTFVEGQPCSISEPSRRLRELRALTEYEMDETHSRHLEQRLEVAAPHHAPHYRGCQLYHCFEGDVECEHPSERPERDCLEWSDGSGAGGRRCLESMCALVDGTLHKHGRMLHDGHADKECHAWTSETDCEDHSFADADCVWTTSQSECATSFSREDTTVCRLVDKTIAPSSAFAQCFGDARGAQAERIPMARLVAGDLVLSSPSEATRVVVGQHRADASASPMIVL